MKRRLVAALPVKALQLSKSRLGSVVADRAALSLRMLRHVVQALTAAEVFEAIAVVSDDPAALDAARTMGAVPLSQRSRGLNEACAEATQWALEQGCHGLLIAHADLPQLTAREVRRMVAAMEQLQAALSDASPDDAEPAGTLRSTSEGWTWGSERLARAAVVAPDHAESGTNLILSCPPDALPWRFGPSSFSLHLHEIAAAGLRHHVFRSAGTGHDVDTATDLAAWAGGPL